MIWNKDNDTAGCAFDSLCISAHADSHNMKLTEKKKLKQGGIIHDMIII